MTRALLVAHDEPHIEIRLELGETRVELLAECHPVEFVEHRSIKAFADAVHLWMLRLRPGVIDVLDREIEFVLGPIGLPTVLRATIREHATEWNPVRLEER